MLKKRPITDSIFYIGVNDRQKHKFENMLPLPHGVSYNSYLVEDEKIAIIDSVDSCFGDLFIDKIRSIAGTRPVDYLIINHMEPDHSGSIRLLRSYFPHITLVGNNKTLDMVKGYYGICDNTLEVKDGDTLTLDRHTLQFHLTPMVHWPETMMTFDQTDHVLFAGDGFGCFGTLDGGITDEQMDTEKYWDEMVRYYANIVGKYGMPVQKALQKLSGLPIQTICSTHGPVWRKRMARVVDMYDKLSRYEPLHQGVVIVYGSMYGHTEQMAETVAQGLAEAGQRHIVMHNVSTSDASDILRDIFKYKGLVIGCPTYSNELYPAVDALLKKIEIRGIKNRLFGCFGSYSWAGVAVKRLTAFAEQMHWETVCPSPEEKQAMQPAEYEQCLQLGEQMATRL